MSWLVSGGRWRAWRRSALPYIVGPRVLEIGFGPGHLLVDLSVAGYNAVGIDLSPEMCKQACRRIGRAGLANRVIAADARALPFSNEAFDSIVLTFPTSVLRDPLLWKESARVLHSGSPIVIVLSARPRGRTQRKEQMPDASSPADVARDFPIPDHLFRCRAFDVLSEDASVQVLIALRTSVNSKKE